MVLFIAGAQKISTSLYDAARVDGAGAVREFFAVTLPGLRNELVVAFVLTTINALRSFDLIYNATSGGPGNETYVPALLVFQNAFRYNKVGYSCAIAVMLAIVIFAVAIVINLLAERGQDGMKSSPYERVVTYSVLIAFTVMVLYPILSILFLALHKKTDLVTGFAFPTHPDLSSFTAAWSEDDGAGGPGFASCSRTASSSPA